MSSRSDKNSKLPSGKDKESSSAGKPKGKASASQSKSPGKSAKASKATPPASVAKTTKAKASKSGPSRPAKSRAEKTSVGPKAVEKKSAEKPVVPAKSKAPSATRGIPSKPPRRTQPKKSETAESLGLEEFSIALIRPGETKERIWRTKSFHQMPVQREFGFPDVAPELPSQYHQDKLVLMPKDPEYMFCYWELTPSLLDEKAQEKIPEANYRETLKINWESRSLFEPNFTFIPVFFWARKWYFGVPQVGQRYQVELGWLSDTGHFISIIRSNLSELPESWAATQKRLSDAGDVLAYTARASKVLGSSEHLAVEDIRTFAPEWNLSSESFSSSSWSRGAGEMGAGKQASGNCGQAGAPVKPGAKKAAAPRAHLEISGKVLPGIRVAVGGNPVPTDSLGCFRTEFPYEKDILRLELTDHSGARRSFAYDLKELVLN